MSQVKKFYENKVVLDMRTYEKNFESENVRKGSNRNF